VKPLWSVLPIGRRDSSVEILYEAQSNIVISNWTTEQAEEEDHERVTSVEEIAEAQVVRKSEV